MNETKSEQKPILFVDSSISIDEITNIQNIYLNQGLKNLYLI